MEGLKVVEFPTVIEGELKFLGKFTTMELLTSFLISIAAFQALSNFSTSTAFAASLITFASIILLKLTMPEEVGYYFPLYASYFALKRKTVYAHELDTTKYIPAMSFVDGWIVKLTNGFAAVIEVEPVNFFYSLPADQRSFIDAYKSMLNSIDFPIQILSVSSEFDISRYMNKLLMRFRDGDIAENPVLREALDDYIRWLDSEIRDVFQRRYFVIVSAKKKSEEAAVAELKRRVETVVAGLRRGGIQAKILEREDILAIYEILSSRMVLPGNYSSSKFIAW
ncbi:hypothetical protein DRP05_04200 [Archaeoglobales archaeon]|nr:MAG: hypothetical protein DRP05_04200 [Archaeoglobales archaeon]